MTASRRPSLILRDSLADLTSAPVMAGAVRLHRILGAQREPGMIGLARPNLADARGLS
jgi:hypothetical protein